MKQTIILALVALVASVGGGAWFGAFLAPPRVEAVKSAPQTASKPAGAAKGAATPARADVARAPDSAAAVDTTPVTAKPTVDAGRVAAKAARAKAVGRILVGMKTTEAAGILGKMSDHEVEAIVRQLNPKQVAGLLAVLPDDRAAALSRRLLEPDSLR